MGPILGSATTVIVFMPVLMLDLPVGQLFRDIGIAISCRSDLPWWYPLP